MALAAQQIQAAVGVALLEKQTHQELKQLAALAAQAWSSLSTPTHSPSVTPAVD
jgi:hypothetical protein